MRKFNLKGTVVERMKAFSARKKKSRKLKLRRWRKHSK